MRAPLARQGSIPQDLLAAGLLPVALAVRPVVRRALAALGRLRRPGQVGSVIDEVVGAAASLSAQGAGALIVLERGARLAEHIESGVRIDGVVSRRLLESLFQPRAPLREGAAIISGGRLAAAACLLPLSPAGEAGPGADGLRRRAALALTGETDAVAVVVSEQTGAISLAANGELGTPLDLEGLRRRLRELAGVPPPPAPPRAAGAEGAAATRAGA